MCIAFRHIVLFGALPIINFLLWYMIGVRDSALLGNSQNCPERLTVATQEVKPCQAAEIKQRIEAFKTSQDSNKIPSCGKFFVESEPDFYLGDTEKFMSYKTDNLVVMKYPYTTTFVNAHDPVPCTRYVNPHVAQKQDCFALVHVQGVDATPFSLRYDRKWIALKGRLVTEANVPTGYFKKVGHEKGRSRLAEKMGPFIQNLEQVEDIFKAKLKQWGRKPGDNIVLMVVNEGELDLLLNFACSCKFHNISLAQTLVVAASPEIVHVIESTGAAAVYHESFGYASKQASAEYLDKVFVDMMWYKSFSLWLLLKLRYNVLFQDVDLVWFREPYDYFKNIIDAAALKGPPSVGRSGIVNKEGTAGEGVGFGISDPVDGFFSDDGQRGIRYTPFFANSGFYYIVASYRTQYFAWTVMTQFDILQITGSHQNVFTTRLEESMDLGNIKPKLLTLNEFPNGLKYHHDKPFMRGMQEKIEFPYSFHMCWTLNKEEKLVYFDKTSMWYLSKQCSIDSLIPGGQTARKVTNWVMAGQSELARWELLSSDCCHLMTGAP